MFPGDPRTLNAMEYAEFIFTAVAPPTSAISGLFAGGIAIVCSARSVKGELSPNFTF